MKRKNTKNYSVISKFWFKCLLLWPMGFPGGSVVKNSPADTRDLGLIPESGRSPGGGHGNPLPYFRLGNPMDRGAWWVTVHGVVKSQT